MDNMRRLILVERFLVQVYVYNQQVPSIHGKGVFELLHYADIIEV